MGCKVKIFVTDNTENVFFLTQLEESNVVITNPCSAHVADRLAIDIDTSDVKTHIILITKYFRMQIYGTHKRVVTHFLLISIETGLMTACKPMLISWLH